MYLPLYQNNYYESIAAGGGGVCHAGAKLASYGFERYHPSLPKSCLHTENTSGS